VRTNDFDYLLPSGLIAQTPVEPRDQSRLMILDRSYGSLKHRRFFQIGDFLKRGDVLVFNDSRVIPARLAGRKVAEGGRLEILLLRRISPGVWETLMRPAKRVRVGTRFVLVDEESVGEGQNPAVSAAVIELLDGGRRVIQFSDDAALMQIGKIPLPPYIRVPLTTPERYQTVYAREAGSAAAPTAGLHFTPTLIRRIRDKGVICLFVTLHVGLDTFLPVREENPREHPIHREYGVLSEEVALELSRAKQEGRRIICVGTTSVRLIEAVVQSASHNQVEPFSGWVDLFILPGYRFRLTSAMVTNFHLPQSTLLMLVTAFAGRDLIQRAYQEAIARKYRFYSFGDATLIL
jgi:S-adenosylmethionine:tRNA ribosyltransferase-isomerase